MKIAMIGTRGVPAQYGGFETAVEEIGTRLSALGHEVVVYCRAGSAEGAATLKYRGMRRVCLPAPPIRSLETLVHSALSSVHAGIKERPDVAILFNIANAPIAAVNRLWLKRQVLHVDGLESQRSKWGAVGKSYYRQCEWFAARLGLPLIADAEAVAEYYFSRYKAVPIVIAYGARIVEHEVIADRIAKHGLKPGGFVLVVARVEPENHLLEMVHAYRQSGINLPLVVVGGNPYRTEYVRQLEDLCEQGGGSIKKFGSVWDQELLDALYAGCAVYLHGHSVGGTNPSLLRAMGAGAPVIAHDNRFNREVLSDGGRFFSSSDELTALLKSSGFWSVAKSLGQQNRDRVRASYDWDDIACKYQSLLEDVKRGR